jgi:hypothetical protein
MCQEVLIQVVSLDEGSVADVTVLVALDVAETKSFCKECLMADITFEVLNSVVNLQVSLQKFAAGEACIADGAMVWAIFVVQMDPFMPN